MKLHCFAVLCLSIALLTISRDRPQEEKQKTETTPPTASQTATPDPSKIAIEMVVEDLIKKGPVADGPKRVADVLLDKPLRIQTLLKSRIESGLKNVVANDSGSNDAATLKTKPLALKSLSKGLIEGDLKSLVASADDQLDSDSRAVQAGSDLNPACQPGLVNWHADFATACALSEKSGKPVMLFQLLGQLDERFT